MSTPPPGWADDPLSTYLDVLCRNQWATFHRKHNQVDDLVALDVVFEKLLMGARDPNPIMPITFPLRSHSAYRAAVGMTMGGQLYEAQAMLRLCLEHASYGFFIGADEARWIRWMNRNDSESAKDKVRKEFTHGAVKRALITADKTVGKNSQFLYERLIDFGAHPNEQGFSMSTLISENSGETQVSAINLHAEGTPFDFALENAAQVAICTLHIAYLIYPTREEFLRIRPDLDIITVKY